MPRSQIDAAILEPDLVQREQPTLGGGGVADRQTRDLHAQALHRAGEARRATLERRGKINGEIADVDIERSCVTSVGDGQRDLLDAHLV